MKLNYLQRLVQFALTTTAAILTAVVMAEPCHAHEIVVEWNRDLRPRVGRIRKPIISIAKIDNGQIFASGTWGTHDENGDPIAQASREWVGLINDSLNGFDWIKLYGDSLAWTYKTELIHYGDNLASIGQIARNTPWNVSVRYLNLDGDLLDSIMFEPPRELLSTPRAAFFNQDGSINLVVNNGIPYSFDLYKIDADSHHYNRIEYDQYSDFGNGKFQGATSAAPLRDGGLLVTGVLFIEREYGNSREIGNAGTVAKINGNGAIEWVYAHLDSVLYRPPDHYYFNLYGYMKIALEHSSGMIYSSGATDKSDQAIWGLSLNKYSPNGDLIWEKLYNDNFSESDTYFNHLIELRPDIIAAFGHIRFRARDERTQGLYIALFDTSGILLNDTFVRGEWIEDNDHFFDIEQCDSNRVLALTYLRFRLLSIRFDLDPPESVSEPFSPHPTLLSLSAYPNPFNSRTTLTFDLQTGGVVRLALVDPLGRRLNELIPGQAFPPGAHSLPLDAGDLPSGVYMLRLESSSGAVVRPLTLVR